MIMLGGLVYNAVDVKAVYSLQGLPSISTPLSTIL